MDLFDYSMQEELAANAPLAARMRPRTLDEIVGQDHIIGKNTSNGFFHGIQSPLPDLASIQVNSTHTGSSRKRYK